MTSAAVAILGAGVMGASVAHHLAARGVRDVILLDRAAGPGEGSTGKATGGFRAQYATAINVRLSLLSREKLRRFRDEVGVDPGYVEAGYLWLAASERELDLLREGQRVQHAEGLREAVEVDLDDIGRLNPAVDRRELLGGVFCPTDGFIRPLRILEGYLAAAERLGAKVEWGVQMKGFERLAGGRISAVVTDRRTIPVGAVVNTAGAWAAPLAALAGIDLPVVPLRRQVAATEPGAWLPASMPMTIFAGDGFHLRVRDGRVLLLWPTPGVPGEPESVRVDPAWIAAVADKARRRIPILREAVIDAGASWAGLYEMSPDRHAIVGSLAACPNYHFLNGSSGHGVMHAPALGQLLAEQMIDGRASSLDIHALRPSRFAEGESLPISELL